MPLPCPYKVQRDSDMSRGKNSSQIGGFWLAQFKRHLRSYGLIRLPLKPRSPNRGRFGRDKRQDWERLRGDQENKSYTTQCCGP
jgi:hypothetical protein